MNENKTGLLLVNLGSPDSAAVSDVRKYLNEFLLDEHVIDIPYMFRALLVKGFIIPFRVKNSAEAYQKIWTRDGSPLKVISENFAALVEKKIKMPVAVAMRYGNPTPVQALKELENKIGALDEILVAPMYPHYAMSSYETALEFAVKNILSLKKNIKIKTLQPFYSEANYISSLAKSIEPHIAQNNFDNYLFSYHGIPVRHLKKSDTTKTHCYINHNCCEIKSPAWETCYKHQVIAATKLVAEKLNLDWSKVIISFQSRLDDEWIKPFTDKLFEELPKRGAKKLLVVSPSFVTDCLETLEELDIRGKESFLKNGGEIFVRVPCLNTNEDWVNAFAEYCANESLWRSVT